MGHLTDTFVQLQRGNNFPWKRQIRPAIMPKSRVEHRHKHRRRTEADRQLEKGLILIIIILIPSNRIKKAVDDDDENLF